VSEGRDPKADPRNDQQLVAAINAGDLRAFDALYYRYRDWVVRLARRFTGNGEDALDVVQETFSYVFRKFPGFHLRAQFTTFLYPVVRNLSLAAVRKRRGGGGEEVILGVPAPQEKPGGPGELGIVLAGLPTGQREVLLMRFVDGMSLDEIAKALGIPVGTVKSRMHNALAALRADPRTRDYFDPA